MRGTQLDIRIGPTHIAASLRPWRGGHVTQRQPIEDDGAGAVLSQLLARLMRGHRLPAPHIRVALAGPAVRAGVLRFDKLPRGSQDRSLIVAQRFCREHKLDPRTTAVAFSIHPSAKPMTYSVLTCALPRGWLEDVVKTFALHGLHCDVIASELSIGLTELQRQGAGETGVLVVAAEHACTLLLLGATGQPVSVATVMEIGDEGLAERLVARVRRFASHLGVDPAGLPLHLYAANGEVAEFSDALRKFGCLVRPVADAPAAERARIVA